MGPSPSHQKAERVPAEASEKVCSPDRAAEGAKQTEPCTEVAADGRSKGWAPAAGTLLFDGAQNALAKSG